VYDMAYQYKLREGAGSYAKRSSVTALAWR
jgi:hypothetical protein